MLHIVGTKNIRDTLEDQRLELQDSPSRTLSLIAPTNCSRSEGVGSDTTSMIGCGLNTN